MRTSPYATSARPDRRATQRTLRRLRLATPVVLAVGALTLTGTGALAVAPHSDSPSVSSPQAARAAAAQGAVVGAASLGATAGASTSAPPATPAAPKPASSTSSATAAAPACSLGAKLVPTCGLLWGAAPAAFDFGDRMALTRAYESAQGRPVDVYHGYKTNGTLFPSAAEIAIANDPAQRRMLLINWRPGTDMTWKQITAGSADGRIDKLAAYIKASYNKPFFMAVWHEPEHFVNPNSGSGMEATDYRNMVRHVITRLKAQGATKVVFVQIFQGYPRYAATSWWPNLYPGDDVIDWLASDSYNSGKSTGYNAGGFSVMVNRVKTPWQGFYNWATSKHPGKPLMLGEWGVFAQPSELGRQGWFFNDAKVNLSKYPALKMMMYFNAATLDKGTTRIDSTTSNRDAFRSLTASIPRIDLSSAL
jgi:hypothetical protein